MYSIEIFQFAEHGSLDNCREGFLAGLAEEGFVEGKNLQVKVSNAGADMSKVSPIAAELASDRLDLICAIATSAAQAAYNAVMERGIPVIFTAITDVQGAQLADADDNPVGEVTGTSDRLPVEAQLKMIREILPDAKTIGILYATSEANSISGIRQYEELAEQYGFTIKAEGVTSVSEVGLAAASLVPEVDCLSNLADNTVVSALPMVLAAADEQGIPVFGSEVEQVKKGCLAAEGLDYIELGRATGKMAARVLKGEIKASEMKYETFSESELYVNTAVSNKLGIKLSDAVKRRAAQVFTEITE